MNADDRQVIRNHAERILDGRGDVPRFHAQQIIALLDKPEEYYQGDYVLVPKEPNIDMRRTAWLWAKENDFPLSPQTLVDAFKVMLAAAPVPPCNTSPEPVANPADVQQMPELEAMARELAEVVSASCCDSQKKNVQNSVLPFITLALHAAAAKGSEEMRESVALFIEKPNHKIPDNIVVKTGLFTEMAAEIRALPNASN